MRSRSLLSLASFARSCSAILYSERGAYLTPDKRCVRTCPPKTFLNRASASALLLLEWLAEGAHALLGTARACTLCSSKTAATCSDGSAAGATSWYVRPSQVRSAAGAASHLAELGSHSSLNSIEGWCLSSGQCYSSKHIPEGTYCPSASGLLKPLPAQPLTSPLLVRADRVLEPCPGGPGVTKCDSGGVTLGCNGNTGYHLQSSSQSCVLWCVPLTLSSRSRPCSLARTDAEHPP